MDASADCAAEIIESSAKAIAQWTVAMQEERTPELRALLGAPALDDLRADTHVRVLHLANSVAFAEPALLCAHVEWSKASFAARHVPDWILTSNLDCLAEVLDERLAASAMALVRPCVEAAARTARTAPTELPSMLEGDAPHISVARRYVLATLEGDRAGALTLLERALDAGADVPDLFEHVIQRSQSEIGRLWQIGDVSVAEEHLASTTSEWVVAQLVAKAPRRPSNGRALIATSVGGDTHSFGVRLVADSFELAGWRAFFLGASTPLVDLVGTVLDRKAELLALSANLGCHLRELKRVIDAVRTQPETARVGVLVGGRALNAAQDLWRKVGADAYARSAREAVSAGARMLDSLPPR